MEAIASQITSLTSVYSIVYSDADQRKHQSSASLAFVWGIHRGPVNSPHKWPVTRKMFHFDDVIMMCTWLSRVRTSDWEMRFTMIPCKFSVLCHGLKKNHAWREKLRMLKTNIWVAVSESSSWHCFYKVYLLTHWGWVMHVCAINLVIFGSGSVLCQAITWINIELLLFGPIGTNWTEMLTEILIFPLKKNNLKMSDNWGPFHLRLDVIAPKCSDISRELVGQFECFF